MKLLDYFDTVALPSGKYFLKNRNVVIVKPRHKEVVFLRSRSGLIWHASHDIKLIRWGNTVSVRALENHLIEELSPNLIIK